MFLLGVEAESAAGLERETIETIAERIGETTEEETETEKKETEVIVRATAAVMTTIAVGIMIDE